MAGMAAMCHHFQERCNTGKPPCTHLQLSVTAQVSAAMHAMFLLPVLSHPTANQGSLAATYEAELITVIADYMMTMYNRRLAWKDWHGYLQSGIDIGVNGNGIGVGMYIGAGVQILTLNWCLRDQLQALHMQPGQKHPCNICVHKLH